MRIYLSLFLFTQTSPYLTLDKPSLRSPAWDLIETLSRTCPLTSDEERPIMLRQTRATLRPHTHWPTSSIGDLLAMTSSNDYRLLTSGYGKWQLKIPLCLWSVPFHFDRLSMTDYWQLLEFIAPSSNDLNMPGYDTRAYVWMAYDPQQLIYNWH
jgi:hypothetical protein